MRGDHDQKNKIDTLSQELGSIKKLIWQQNVKEEKEVKEVKFKK